MKRIGLFFGSFNPIHTGHLFVAEMALERAELDEVWFVISPASPYKFESGLLADHDDRLIMTMKATQHNPKFKISNVEFFLPSPSYTALTLEVIKQENPNDNFYLICGTDVYVDIPNWYLGKEVIEQVDFVVYPRNSSTVYSPESMKGKTTWLEGVPTLEISSTFIRNQIKNKKSTEYILPAEVKEFIIFNNLYQ
jgi:nicotinate-nucleotide adenylyltransferase